MRLNRLAALAVVAGLGACAAQDDDAGCVLVSKLVPDHAEADAGQAVRAGDHHLLGVYGRNAVEAPGVLDYHDATVIALEDSMEWGPCARFSDHARRYAERYNRAVVAARAPVSAPPEASQGRLDGQGD